MTSENRSAQDGAPRPRGHAFRSRTARIVVVVAAALLFLALAAYLRSVTTPLIVGLVVAYVLDPLVGWLERRGLRRLLAVTLVYVVFIAAILFTLGAIIPPAYGQVRNFASWVETKTKTLIEMSRAHGLGGFAEETPQQPDGPAPDAPPADTPVSEAVDTPLDAGPETPMGIGADTPAAETAPGRGHIVIPGLMDGVKENAPVIAEKVLRVTRTLIERSVDVIGGAVGALVDVVLVAIYAFFFLLGMQRFKDTVKSYLPGRYREEALRVFKRLDQSYSNFFRSRALVCFICGLLTSIGLWLVGIPFWLLIGMAVGFLGVVPYVGLILGLLPSVIIAYLMPGGGWGSVVEVLIVFGAVECIEPIFTPLILSRGVKLHPMSILVALLVGAHMFGLFGAVIAVPLASTVKTLCEEFVLPPLRELASEKPVEAAPDGSGEA